MPVGNTAGIEGVVQQSRSQVQFKPLFLLGDVDAIIIEGPEECPFRQIAQKIPVRRTRPPYTVKGSIVDLSGSGRVLGIGAGNIPLSIGQHIVHPNIAHFYGGIARCQKAEPAAGSDIVGALFTDLHLIVRCARRRIVFRAVAHLRLV